jgi:nucleoside-diphosphate-sugar epimerase
VRHERARRVLGFDPRPLETTIADTFEWYGSVGWLNA